MSCQDAANLLEGQSPRAASLKVVTVFVMVLAVMGLFSDNRFAKLCEGTLLQEDSHNIRISLAGGQQLNLSRAEDQQLEAQNTVDNEEPLTHAEDQEVPEEKPIHVLFGLSGNHSGFFAEFEVALKSILLNAPHHQNMHIHIMADQKAYDYLPTVWQETQIDGSEWWRNITITPYNVEPHIRDWEKIVKNSTKITVKKDHTMGAYFRLFAHKVLPKDAGYALYLDTDVAFLSNLNNVFQYPPKNPLETSAPLFIISNRCDGFMFINVQRLGEFWEDVSSIQWTAKMLNHGDQSMVFRVGENYVGSVAILPEPWDVTVSELWRFAKNKETITKYRPELGYVHFNGGGTSKDSYWETKFFEDRKNHLGLPATFYRELPWTWARFMGKGPGGLDNTGIRIQGSTNSPTFIHRIPANTTLRLHTNETLLNPE